VNPTLVDSIPSGNSTIPPRTTCEIVYTTAVEEMNGNATVRETTGEKRLIEVLRVPVEMFNLSCVALRIRVVGIEAAKTIAVILGAKRLEVAVLKPFEIRRATLTE
jgi:hypothetical protein